MAKRMSQLLLIVCLVTGTLWAADDPFVGTWKLDPDKSTLTDQMKVEHVSGNKYAFDFGGGTPELIVADGTDQPGLDGTTLAVISEDPSAWKVVRKKDGHVLLTGDWKLSPDGNTLTDTFRANRPDGSISSLDYVYARTAGTSGFPGTWESVKEKVNSTYEFQIQPWEGDGLSFINSAQKSTKNMRFDGKDYPTLGPNLPPDFVSSGHRVDERTVEMTEKIQGKVRDTQQIQISADGKTMTMTVHPKGRSKPNILVFARE